MKVSSNPRSGSRLTQLANAAASIELDLLPRDDLFESRLLLVGEWKIFDSLCYVRMHDQRLQLRLPFAVEVELDHLHGIEIDVPVERASLGVDDVPALRDRSV